AFAGRPRQRRWTERSAGFDRVVAAEIDRLAYFGHAIVEGLAAFVLHQRNQPAAPLLQEIACALEYRRPRLNRGRLPRREASLRGRDRGARGPFVGLAHTADHGAVDGRADRPLNTRARDTVDERHRVRGRMRLADLGNKRSEARAIAELDARRIAALGTIEIARQRDLRMARALRVTNPALRPPQDAFDRNGGIRGDRHERRGRSVLEQPPPPIGEEITGGADPRIDPHRPPRQGLPPHPLANFSPSARGLGPLC